MKTIIQTIGPLYGDDVNGTVFGQPNGSVYTPPKNSLKVVDENALMVYVKSDTTYNRVCNAAGTGFSYRVAFAPLIQTDGWKYYTDLATDSGFSNVVSSQRFAHYAANGGSVPLATFGKSSDYTVLAGTTYYARMRIVDSLDNTIVVSDGYTLTGVA